MIRTFFKEPNSLRNIFLHFSNLTRRFDEEQIPNFGKNTYIFNSLHTIHNWRNILLLSCYSNQSPDSHIIVIQFLSQVRIWRPFHPPSLRSDHIYMTDAHSAESNENSYFRFLFFELQLIVLTIYQYDTSTSKCVTD